MHEKAYKLTIRLALAAVVVACLWRGPARAQEEIQVGPPFVEVTDAAGIQGPRVGNEKITGQAWGDFDRDGWIDLYLTDFGSPQKTAANRLYRNTGVGYTLAWTSPESDFTTSLAWGDYDGDGLLELLLGVGGTVLLRHDPAHLRGGLLADASDGPQFSLGRAKYRLDAAEALLLKALHELVGERPASLRVLAPAGKEPWT